MYFNKTLLSWIFSFTNLTVKSFDINSSREENQAKVSQTEIQLKIFTDITTLECLFKYNKELGKFNTFLMFLLLVLVINGIKVIINYNYKIKNINSSLEIQFKSKAFICVKKLWRKEVISSSMVY